jgi:molecular chaperone DnaK
MAGDNKSLGQFILDGIMPAPRGVPQIEVTFDIDASGILTVSAKDKATGKSQNIRIESSTGLSKDEIERMKKDAEMHAEEDKNKKALIEARNMADTLSYTTEKAMKDAGDKITAEEKKPVEDAITELNKVKNGDDLDAIKKATETLSQAAQKIGEKLYKAAEAANPQAGATGEASSAQGGQAEGATEAPKDAETEPAAEAKPEEEKK